MNQDEASAIILEQYRNHKHLTKLNEPCIWKELVNSACGDEITLYLRVDGRNNILQRVSYTGHGCSVCIASAEIFCQDIEGLKLKEAQFKAKQFFDYMNGTDNVMIEGQTVALMHLRKFPIRRKCALIVWEIFLELAKTL